MKTLKHTIIIATILLLLIVECDAIHISGKIITQEQETTVASTLTQRNKISKPKGTKIRKYESRKKSIRIAWEERSGEISGYQIQYSTNKNFKKKNTKLIIIKRKTKTSKILRDLEPGTKYHIRIRTYKIVEGKKHFSKWSKKKTIKTNTTNTVWGSIFGSGCIVGDDW